MTTERPRKALLLGAGFSYDLGMPLASEVTEVFLGMFNAKNAKELGDALAKQQPYGKDRSIRRDAIHAGLDLLLNYKSEGGANYEEFLAQLEALPWREHPECDSHHYLFSVFYDLLCMILVAYQSHSYRLLYGRNRPWFLQLPNLLSATTETWVFSLNHDLYAECLAIDLGIPVTYGDVEEIAFPISNLLPHSEIRLSCLSRKQLCKDGIGWFVGRHGINLVRLHGGLCELDYKDGSLICNPTLTRHNSLELMAEFARIESMGYYHQGRRVPSGRERTITGPDGTLDIISRTILTGGNKYSKTTNMKEGEEKLKVFDDVLRQLDELTIIGFGFGDPHVNYRVSNAMVLNQNLRIRIVDPAWRRWPEFLQQFDYDERLRSACCGAAQWMSYIREGKWDEEQTKALKESASLRTEIRRRVEAGLPR